MSIAKRIAKNAGATSLQKFISIGQHLVLVPLFLHYWGPETYGEWLTLTAIPAVLALSDLGLATAFSNEFVIRFAASKMQSASNLFKTGLAFLILTFFLAIILGSLSLYIALENHWLSKLTVGESVAIQVLAFLGTTRVIAFFAGIYEAFYRVTRNAHLYMFYSALASALQVLAGILVLVTGHGVVCYAVSQSVVTLALTVFLCKNGRSLVPQLPPGTLIRDKNELYSLARKGISYMLVPFQQALSLQGTIIVIRGIIGPEAVALFGTLRTLSNTAVQGLSIATTSLFPELQLSIAEKNSKQAHRLYSLGILISFFIGLLASLVLAFIGIELYEAWTRGVLQPSYSLWLVFLLMLLLRSLWWPASIVFTAANKPEVFTLVGFIAALVGIVLSWILASSYGLLGVAFGCVLMEAILVLWSLPSSAIMLGIAPKQLPSLLIKTACELTSETRKKLINFRK